MTTSTARNEPEPEPQLTGSEIARRYAIASVERELAALRARPAPAASAPPLPTRGRRRSAASVVYTVRLGHAELDELERRAQVLGVRPTTLARSYIRAGLSGRGRTPGTHAIDEIEAAVARLRDVVR